MKKYLFPILSMTILFSNAYVAFAEAPLISLDSHVHGVSQMTILSENQTVELIFQSPAINLLGFEHKAKTQQQIDAVKDVHSKLKNTNDLFSLIPNCQALEAEVDTSSLVEAENIEYAKSVHDEHGEHGHDEYGYDEHAHDEHAHDEHAHDEHAHDEHAHDEHGHDEHGHDEHGHAEHGHDEHAHNEHEQHQESHREITGHYRFHCEKSAGLSAIEVVLFRLFPGIDKIQVMWIVANQQGATTLNKDNTRIELK